MELTELPRQYNYKGMDTSHLPALLHQRMKEKGIKNPSTLARLTGIDEGHMSRVMNNKIGFNLSTFLKVLLILDNITLEDIKRLRND
jgi:histone acetyltransferase (RNA polymerase elongator complex component)